MSERKASVLIVGSGGREATLAHAYSKSSAVGQIYLAPGNDLVKYVSEKPVEIFPNTKAESTDDIIALCKENRFDLVDVATEYPLAQGLVDSLRSEGIFAFGPSRLAAQLESDKAFAKDFMSQYGISTAEYQVFDDYDKAAEYLSSDQNRLKDWYIKAAGLADGRGALPLDSNHIDLGESAIQMLLYYQLDSLPHNAGKKFIVEEYLKGEEFSAFYLADGSNFVPLGFAQDHKKRFNNDQGDNTGGMGVVTRPQFIDKHFETRVRRDIIRNLNVGLNDRRIPYEGVLYVGGIYNSEEKTINVLEFNCRWGDSEAEGLLPGIVSDYFGLTMSIANGQPNQLLENFEINNDGKIRVSVAAVDPGYPDRLVCKNSRVYGLDKLLESDEVLVYGAGIKEVDGYFYANGGRLFHVVGEGDSVLEAREKVYGALSGVYIKGESPGQNLLEFRTDIGMRELQR